MNKPTCLIADDALFMRTMLKNILGEEYDVVGEAPNGLAAIELAGNLKPDFMTLDITMPELDGIEAIEKIHEASPDTKIIMCSAMGQRSKVIEAIQKGASDYIVKPFERDRVLQAIDNVLNR